MLKCGPLVLGTRPCVAIAIQEPIPVEELRRMVSENVLVELRLDALADVSAPTLESFVSYYQEFPLLATLRHAGEGGGWRGSESERLAAYRAVLPLVQAVDVEIATGEIAADVISLAREAGCISVGSFHDFAATPDSEQLEAIHGRGRALGFDVVKVAARCNSPEDLRRLASFTIDHARDHVIVVGMGEHGLSSRIFFPLLGSLVTYTFLGTATAPGQLNCTDTLKYLDVFQPAVR